MSSKLGFQSLLERFFLDWLIAGRGVSQRTVEAYRDAFVLFLHWLNDVKDISADTVTMDDFTMGNVEEFLIYLDRVRNNTPKTVNCRLAVLRSFCKYVSYKDPTRLNEMTKILSISKRTETRAELSYLDSEEIGWLVDACDKRTALGRETRLMIRLLYNSGARISETLALKASDITFLDDRSCKVFLFGKGRKERTLPLWKETADSIQSHLKEHGITGDDYLFSGRNVEHLTRSGARSRIDGAVKRAAVKHPSLAKKSISAHTFRHSTAVSMLVSGINISTIAIWLGHEDIQTTHQYVVVSMKMKEDAIAKIRPDWGKPKAGRFKPDPKALRFLMSL